jgi:transposase-like protein
VPRPSRYSEDFRRDAVELVHSTGRTLRDVGRELGVNHETLRGWVSAAKRADEQQAGAGKGDPAESGRLFVYINYYNNKRLHSTVNHQTPREARVCYRPPIALAA